MFLEVIPMSVYVVETEQGLDVTLQTIKQPFIYFMDSVNHGSFWA